MRRFDTVLFDLTDAVARHASRTSAARRTTRCGSWLSRAGRAEMRRRQRRGRCPRSARDGRGDRREGARALQALLRRALPDQDEAHAGVLELMAALKAEGFRLAVVSNNKPDEAVRPLVAEHFGALCRHRQLAVTAQAPPQARARHGERRASRRSARCKSRAVYVGDSEVDIETASGTRASPASR